MSKPNIDDETNLRELVRLLWAHKWFVGGTTFTATVIAVIFALILPDIYRAEALLAPNNRQGAGGLSALAAQYGGIASLAGITLDGRSEDKTALGLRVLQSRKFISEFVERHDILVPLMAATDWNAASDELVIDGDLYDSAAGKWIEDGRSRKATAPTLQQAYKAFSGILTVSQDRKSGFITIAIEHYSPGVSKQWVDWLVKDINLTIMRQDVTEAEQAIKYLRKQIAATSLADLKNVFFGLIEEQTKTVMLASVSEEYLFRTVDPAVAPERKAEPKRALIVAFGMLLGGMVSAFLVFVRNSIVERSD